MTEENESLIEFPCAFNLKVMVLADNDIKQEILTLVNTHVDEDLDHSHVSARPSRTGKYTSLTVTFTATSKAQLDTIYMALSQHDKVRMAL